MNVSQPLLDHPVWDRLDPSKMRLVRFSPLSSALNQFYDDGVRMQVAGVPGEASNSKSCIGYLGMREGIEKGLIGPDTTVVEASSGNTAVSMAALCAALGLRFVAVMSGDVPSAKIDAIRVISRSIGMDLPAGSTVARARELGLQDGYYNPNQYGDKTDRDAGSWNWRAQYTYLAPQLFSNPQLSHKKSYFFAPAGTMGSTVGPQKYALDNGFETTVVPVLCAEGQEVPGARTLSSVVKDVGETWRMYFREEDLQSCTRHAALLLSFLSWSHLPQLLGPSFGLALGGALGFLQKHKLAGTLDVLRDRDGKIYITVFGPDGHQPYIPLYLQLHRTLELSGKIPSDLLSVLG